MLHAASNPSILIDLALGLAEKNRRRELEEGLNNVSDVRRERVRAMGEIADEFFEEYKLRLPQSATFAEYAIGHIKRFVGDKMLVDMNEASIIKYQNDSLRSAQLQRL